MKWQNQLRDKLSPYTLAILLFFAAATVCALAFSIRMPME